MKIDVTKPLVHYNGKEIRDSEDVVLDLRRIIDIAINVPTKDEVSTGEFKTKVHQINKAIYAGKEAELTEKQRTFILELAEKQPRNIISAIMLAFLEENISDKPTETNSEKNKNA